MRGSVGLIVFLLSAPVCSGHCHGNSLPKNVTGLGVICECQDPNSVCYEEVAPASSGCRDPSSVSPFEHWASGDCPKCICVGGPLQNSIDRAGLVVSGEWRAPRLSRHCTLHEPTHIPSHSARAGRLHICVYDFCSVEVVPRAAEKNYNASARNGCRDCRCASNHVPLGCPSPSVALCASV